MFNHIDFQMNYGSLSRDCWFLVGNRCTITAKFKIAATCRRLKTFFERIYDLRVWLDAIQREMWRDGLVYAAKEGHRDLVNFFIEKGANHWNTSFKNAAIGGHRDLVEFFIEKLKKDGIPIYWNQGLESAALGGHRDLVDFFIGKYNICGGDHISWVRGLKGAAQGGHRDLVNFFIQNCINQGSVIEWGSALYSAALGGHFDLVEFFFSKWVNAYPFKPVSGIIYSTVSAAAESGNVDIINFLFSKSPLQIHPDLRFYVVKNAAKGGHRDLVELYLSKIEETSGSVRLNRMSDVDFTMLNGFMSAISGGHFELMEFFVSKGQNDWNNASWAACSDGPSENLSAAIRHHDMRKYVISMRQSSNNNLVTLKDKGLITI